MKQIVNYISIVVFLITCIWFGYICYHKYSLDMICDHIKIYHEKPLRNLKSELEHCITIEEMRHPIKLRSDYQINPDSLGVDWYDQSLRNIEDVNMKLSMLYASQADYLSDFSLLQDAMNSDVLFGAIDYHHENNCTNKVLNINGKKVIYRRPVSVTIPKATNYEIIATKYSYNYRLDKIDTTLIGSRLIQME